MVALRGLDQAQWRINRLYIGASGGCVGASGRYMGIGQSADRAI